MNKEENYKKYYLYSHTRCDKGEIFYIGIGSIDKNFPYQRAFNKIKRNRYWKNITSKTDYKVNILENTNDREVICQLEKDYIGRLGRKDLNTGVLCNLTTGGDANFNISKEVIDRIIKTKKDTGVYKNLSALMKIKMIGNTNGLNDNKEGAHLFVYDALTGKFIKEYLSINKCHRELIKSKSNSALNRAIVTEGTYKGYMFFKTFQGDITTPREIGIIKNKRKVICLDNNTIFDSISDAGRSVNTSATAIRNSIIENKECKNLKFQFV